MTETDPDNEASIVRIVEENGRRVRNVVAPVGGDGWSLALDDLAGNTTTWQDIFPTGDAALQEGFDAIAEQGVAFFIGNGLTASGDD